MTIQRLIKKKLLSWKGKKDRKTLILQGVRQCGKEQYGDTAYINFEESPQTAKIFEKDYRSSPDSCGTRCFTGTEAPAQGDTDHF